MLNLLEEHRTPDGLLTLKVGRDDDGDVCIGFDGYAWHTHADILASLSGLGKEDAVRQFVDGLLWGKAVIAVARVGGKIRDVRRSSLDIGTVDQSHDPALLTAPSRR